MMWTYYVIRFHPKAKMYCNEKKLFQNVRQMKKNPRVCSLRMHKDGDYGCVMITEWWTI